MMQSFYRGLNPLSANSIKWSNTLRQSVTNYLSVFDHIVGLTLKEGLINCLGKCMTIQIHDIICFMLPKEGFRVGTLVI